MTHKKVLKNLGLVKSGASRKVFKKFYMIHPAIAHVINVPDYYRQRRWLGDNVMYIHVADNEVYKITHSH